MAGKTRVETGLDVLLGEGPAIAGLAPGSRLGILLHPASVTRFGEHLVELWAERSDLDAVRLFSPEHGIWGEAQDMEAVGHAVEPTLGVPVVSLYGDDEASLRPATADLDGLDAVVCDLQDVGSRYYTFVYTMAHVMEACRDAGLPCVVLDRPNPIDGLTLEGPPLDPGLTSFVGRYPLPVRHGMTPGELARLFNERYGVGCDLRVVPMAGWSRGMAFAQTGLPWVPPSPNMPSCSTARVYPGGCLVEGTNLSEGRGTTLPFELVGAPWLDAGALTRTLREERLPGVAFRQAAFRPQFQKHAGAVCRGVQVLVRDPEVFLPFRTYLALLRAAIRQGDPFDWRRERYEFVDDRLAIDLLLGVPWLRDELGGNVPWIELERRWEADLESFREERAPFLLYDA